MKLKNKRVIYLMGLILSVYGIYYSIYHYSLDEYFDKLPILPWIILKFLPFVIFIYLLNRLLIGKSRDVRIGFIVLFIALLWLFHYSEDDKVMIKYIRKGGVVSPAIVINKRHEARVPPTIYWKYTVDGQVYHGQRPCEKELYKKLFIGDTILIRYSSSKIDFSIPHKFFPTKEVIKECEKGVFYIGGKRVDSLP